MIKKLELGYRGMSKDLAKDKQSEKYFNAKNIRILATDQKSSFSVTNEHGNERVFDIPDIFINIPETQIEYSVGTVSKTISYSTIGSVAPRCEIEEEYSGNTNSGAQVIVGTKDMRDSAMIITTDGNGYNCFWELTGLNNGSFDLNLIYLRNLNITTENLVQIEYNYENLIIQKIYFVDGKNQLRFMNIRQSVVNGDAKELIDVNSTAIDTVSTFKLSQPQVNTASVISGGAHTSGMIQYAYSLYVLNGSQTTISPLSRLVPIDKGVGLGGGEVNEALGMSVVVQVPSVDIEFTHIKLYSLKYTSYNQTPEVLEIADKEIDNYDTFTYYDDGSGGTTVSLEQFLFLGSDPIIPKHIATKDNILFPFNITEKQFDVEIDARCYSHNASTVAVVQENVKIVNGNAIGSPTTVNAQYDNIFPNHDSINRDYEIYKFQANGTTLGGEGKYLKIEVVQSSLTNAQANELQFLKDRELYRFGIIFYNRRGQESSPKWMIDIKAPEGNLEGLYSQIKVELKADFYTLLNAIDSTDLDNVPVGYRVVRADRTLSDQTILTQGMINSMQANFNRSGGAKLSSISERRDAVNNNDAKIMPSMTRMFQDSIPFARATDYLDITHNSPTSGEIRNNAAEGFATIRAEDRRAQTFQHTRLMQMFSPDVMFANIQIDSSYKLNIVGLQRQSAIDNWSTEINPISGIKVREATFTNGITSASIGVSTDVVEGPASELSDQSFYGPTNGPNTRATQQVHREFLKEHVKATSIATKNLLVYGTPEVTETGADFTTYNNISKLRYSNNQKSMLLDYWSSSNDVDDDEKVQIQGMNTNGAKCITFGIGNFTQDVQLMKTLEYIKSITGITENDGVLIAEFVKDKSSLYVGNIYGGFTFESKSVSSYIGIGKYTDIATNNVLIESPGDTFVQDFTFTKMVKDDNEIVDKSFNIISEIVTIRVESTIDLKNRNDLSIGKWNNRFQPRYSEYQKYNRVYSQQPTLIKKIDPGFKFKKVNKFDSRIMASKTKIPGENIDSWTDFLVNESMDLDGKYGPINAVVNSNDIIFTLQDNAVARININPRAQVIGSDGISLELGSGGILNDYDYITTKSGCINKWGAIATQNGFYYVDVLNKAIIQYSGGIKGISDQEGFHFEFNNAFDYNSLVADNPVLGTGISVGYNSVNNDVYFSFSQSTDSFTIAYNESTASFTSYYDYIPAWYINKGARMITTSPTNNELWEHFKGTRNSFYGQHFPSSIEFNASPPGKGDVTFNTAEMRMEMNSPQGLDLKNTGLTKVRVYNEYQDSLQKDLALRSNMFKKNRNWKINLPRVSQSRERIKNPWTFIEFTFDNTAGNKMVMHDITVYYTEY
tara:strand:+ start:14425 stop:18468 length:4044 start_codon:yes stop_codon:yes gene_type:complete